MTGRPSHISKKGIASIKRANKGRKWGRLKPCGSARLTTSPGDGAGIVTVYDGEGNVKGTINPWTREFTKKGGVL